MGGEPAQSERPGNERTVLGLPSSVHCDELVSLPKALLTHYVGRLGAVKAGELNRALMTALDLDEAAEY